MELVDVLIGVGKITRWSYHAFFVYGSTVTST